MGSPLLDLYALSQFLPVSWSFDLVAADGGDEALVLCWYCEMGDDLVRMVHGRRQ